MNDKHQMFSFISWSESSRSFLFHFLLPSVCKQPVVNGLQELGRSFHKQKIGENGMEIQED